MKSFTRTVVRLLAGAEPLRFIEEAQAERSTVTHPTPQNPQAQWSVQVYDWPMPHPDDLPDDQSFKGIRSKSLRAAAIAVPLSFQRQPFHKPGTRNRMAIRRRWLRWR